MHTIYTFGYGGSTTADLFALAEKLDAMVIDTRLSPASRDPQWAKKNVMGALGERYRHVDEFGNLNYKLGGEVRLKDASAGIAKVLPVLERQSVILLCVCWSWSQCHRTHAANALARAVGQTPADVVHLGKKDVPKAPPAPPAQGTLFGD
jgi:hypothetical protein